MSETTDKCSECGNVLGQGDFDDIVLDMRKTSRAERFHMGVEEFEEEGTIWWRVYIRDGSRLVKSSGQLQAKPSDALRELAELVDKGGR